jgi:hypothetical protein
MKLTARHAGLIMIATAVLLAPSAAAHEGCPDHPLLVDHYLLKDAEGRLQLSYKAPSAANATTWKTSLHAGEKKSLDLAFPTPAFQVDESIDLAGHLRFSVYPYYTPGTLPQNPFSYEHPSVHVQLVEGERSVNIGYGYYGSEIELKGSYPGHGKDGAAHTHGAGNDAERGLYTSDLLVRLTFVVDESWFPVDLPPDPEWVFEVHIDGKSFLRLAKSGEAPAVEEPQPPAGNETAPEAPANETGNSTEVPESAPAPAGSEGGGTKAQAAWASPVGATGGLALAGLFAGSGVAVLGWRRGRAR